MPGVTDPAASLLDRLDAGLRAAADPARAAGMAAYMRDRFPFLGIAAPTLRRLEREVFAALPAPSPADLRAVALGCWSRDEREFHYAACDYLRRHVARADPGLLPVARELITTKSWWDTVDPLATRVVGALVRRHGAATEMDAWSRDENVWVIRTALLHQLHYGEATDTGRLFAYCTRQAGHPDFFVRKAIGWALRQYARTDPDAVRHYLTQHRSRLSPLSAREAAKHL